LYCLTVRVRYKRGAVPRSVNIPFHGAFNADGSLVPCPAVSLLNQHRNQVKVVVGGSRGNHANQVCMQANHADRLFTEWHSSKLVACRRI